MNSLGAKADIYSGSRCMASGVLLGRMAAGLASFERNLKNPMPGYAVRQGADNAYRAAKEIERLQTQARPHLKILIERLEHYKDSHFYLDMAKTAADLQSAKKELSSIAQIVVKTCGKRRPQEGEGDAVIVMKTVKRPQAASTPKVEEVMVLPEIPPDVQVEVATPEKETTPWGVIAGVALVIGAAFLAG
jgi:hypothetical protein